MAAFWRGDLTIRKLRALVINLPPGGARARAMEHPWTDTDYVLADVIDTVHRVGVGIIRSNGGKAQTPKPYPRPGQEDGRRIGGRGELSNEQVIERLMLMQGHGRPDQLEALAKLDVNPRTGR